MTLDTLLLDVRAALRGWRRRPAGLLVAVLSVGVGVGAATTVIGSVDRVLSRPPLGLEGVHAVVPWARGEWQPTTRAELELLGAATTFTVAGHRVLPVVVSDGAAERAMAAAVSPAFFDVVEAVPLVGTLIGDHTASAPVAVLSERYWRGRLGSDPTIVGRTVRLDGSPFTVLGVLPATFVYPETDVAFWVPLDAVVTPPGASLAIIARTRNNEDGAAQELRTLGAALPSVSTDAEAAAWRLRPVQDVYITGPLRLAARIGMATAVFVLLIACANVANLMIARGIGRESELAVRRALGAGYGRIASQLLAESAIVAILGGAVGVLIAVWADQGLLALWNGLPDTRPFPLTGGFDGRTLLIAGSATAAAALLFGVAPAWRATRVEPFRAP
jgi:putative ABC transport system permease protein